MINILSVKLWWYVAGALALACIAMLTAYTLRGSQLERARIDNKLLQTELTLMQRTVDGYKSAVQQCNEGTEKLRLMSAEKAAAADQALLRARAESIRHQESNRRLAKLTAGPTPSGAGCGQAIQAIRAELRK